MENFSCLFSCDQQYDCLKNVLIQSSQRKQLYFNDAQVNYLCAFLNKIIFKFFFFFLLDLLLVQSLIK